MSEVTNVTETNEAPEHGVNDKRFNDLIKQVNKLGEEASLGKDSLPKLAHAVVRAAADGVIDPTTKNKKGDDAAAEIYAKYAASESKKAIHEHSAGGTKANVSKLRQLISMGAMTTIDGAEVMQAAFEAREQALSDGLKVKAAYPYYVEVAREQLKSDTALTSDQLKELAEKADTASEKSLEGELKRALAILEGLLSGENKAKLKDDHELTDAAFQALRSRVEVFATLRARAQFFKDAEKLGIKIA